MSQTKERDQNVTEEARRIANAQRPISIEGNYSWGESKLTQESYIYRGNMDHTVPVEGDSRRAQVLCDYDGLIGQFRAGTKVELHLVDGKPITILGTSNIHPDIREYTQATAFQDNGSVGGFFPSDAIGSISKRVDASKA